MSARHLTLYSRVDCHLCEVMAAELRVLCEQHPALVIDVVDIDSRDELSAIYNARVPLLMAGEQVLCEYRLDAAAVVQWLSN